MNTQFYSDTEIESAGGSKLFAYVDPLAPADAVALVAGWVRVLEAHLGATEGYVVDVSLVVYADGAYVCLGDAADCGPTSSSVREFGPWPTRRGTLLGALVLRYMAARQRARTTSGMWALGHTPGAVFRRKPVAI